MHLTILGCNGGIGGNGRKTTCYRIDESILIDAGTGLGDLTLEEMAKIDNIVLTHAHWDHISCLPLLPDAVFAMRKWPIVVWGLPEVIEILKKHVFNDHLWPDFTKIPIIGGDDPIIRLKTIKKDEILNLNGVSFSQLPANHGIPACGYTVTKNNKAIAFSGDTGDDEDFWRIVSTNNLMQAVVVECSYPASLSDLGKLTLHLSTDVISRRIAKLPESVTTIIIHRKPGHEDLIEEELKLASNGADVRFPLIGQEYYF